MHVLDYLNATRDHYAAYHNHKEQMGYAAATLYLAAFSAIAMNPASLWEPPLSKVLRVKFVLGATVVGFLFVGWQLRKREFAADVVKACGDLITEGLKSEPKNCDLAPTTYGEHQFPQFLVERLRSIENERGLLGGPRFSEALTYFIMLVWAVGTVVRVGHAA